MKIGKKSWKKKLFFQYNKLKKQLKEINAEYIFLNNLKKGDCRIYILNQLKEG